MVIFHQKWKKYNGIQLTKSKINLNSKNDKSLTAPQLIDSALITAHINIDS